jgi:anti-sigma regulatory factor (Ser/Thr protein kinase)
VKTERVIIVEHRYERRAIASPSEVGRFRADVSALARAAGASEPQVDDVALAVTEACANAVVHAYGRAVEPGPVAVRATAEDALLTVVVRDWGAGLGDVSPTPGLGMGLPLLQALSQDVELVECADRGVEVRMTFNLDHSG